MKFRATLIITSFFFLLNLGYAQKPSNANNHLEIDNYKIPKSEFLNSQKLQKLMPDKMLPFSRSLSKSTLLPREKALEFSRMMIQYSSGKVQAEAIDARIENEYESPVAYHTRLKQTVNGIPVFSAEMSVSINKISGEVNAVASAFVDEIYVNITVPSLNENRAQEIAENYLNASQDKIYENVELTILNTRSSGHRLTFLVKLVPRQPLGEWYIFVDAVTGDILHATDNAKYDGGKKADGTGMIWDPDPLTTAGVTYGGAYQDFSDTDTSSLNNERFSVTLRNLTKTENGYILEGPYVKLYDAESPSDDFPVLTDSTQFNFTRSQPEFEDVMVYYHIDKSYRHLINLGFNIPGLLEFKADPHGLNGSDNSHYISGTNFVAFGEGGVDDAEDADVIWHEYEHAIQQWTMGGLNRTGEALSIAEGSSDYWAVSYSRSISEYSWGRVFTWDGHNEFWDGRWANLTPETGHYPEDYTGGYGGAPVWSSAVMEIWENLGREITDKLFIQAHYYWISSTTLIDAAASLLQADQELYDNAHLNTIYSILESRGLIDPNSYVPEIIHTPLKDSEDIDGPYRVIAQINDNIITADTSSFKVYYSYMENSGFTSIPMQRVDATDNFFSDLPAADTTVFNIWYYISAANDSGEISMDPASAPDDKYIFRVFVDTIPPEIIHNPLVNQGKDLWPVNVKADVFDNLGVDSVWVEYYLYTQGRVDSGSFELEYDGYISYAEKFDFDTSGISAGDSVHYRIFAIDQAIAKNISIDPPATFNSFEFIDYRGLVLVVDDEYSSGNKEYIVQSEKGTYSRSFNKETASPYLITEILWDRGFIAIPQSMEDAISHDFSQYEFIVHSSGGNEGTMDNLEYRNKLINWLKEDSLARLLIEGGEIGYNWYMDENVSDNLLHISDWAKDYVGDYAIQPEYAGHPMKMNEFTLPDTFDISIVGYGDQDGLTIKDDAYYIYQTFAEATSYPGMIVHNPFAELTSAQIIYYPFNGARLELGVFKNMILNSVDFLMEFNGKVSGIGDDPDPEDILPKNYILHQNYPNPFNPSTTIKFEIPRASRISIQIYNVTGQLVRKLMSGNSTAGSHEVVWNGKNDRGIHMSSGIYFYQLRSGSNIFTKRMLLLK